MKIRSFALLLIAIIGFAFSVGEGSSPIQDRLRLHDYGSEESSTALSPSIDHDWIDRCDNGSVT